MEPVHYLRLLRRHWRVILAIGLLGGVLGWATTLLQTETTERDYFLATHSLEITGGDPTSMNLQRAVYDAMNGEVPTQVARQLDMQVGSLQRQMSAVARPDLGIIEITATGFSARQVEDMADTTAEKLVQYETAQIEEIYETRKKGLENKKLEIQAEYAQLVDQKNAMVAQGVDPGIVEAQIDAKIKESLEIDQQIQQNEVDGATATVLRTRTPASAIALSGPQFEASMTANAEALSSSTTRRNNNAASTGSSSKSIQEQRIQAALGSSGSSSPSSPDALLRGLLGFTLGALIAAGGVIAFDRLDPRMHTKEEAEAAFGFPVLVEIPPLTRVQQREHHVLAHESPRSRAAEAYRIVRSSLALVGGTPAVVTSLAERPNGTNGANGTNGNGVEKANGNGNGIDAEPSPDAVFAPGAATPALDKPTPASEPGSGTGTSVGAEPAATDEVDHEGSIILVTSPGPAEGKTTTVANLAAVLAETGIDVLVINCDFRRPRLHEYLGGPNTPRRVIDSVIPRVRIITNVLSDVKSANPAEVTAEQRRLALAARKHFDVVLLDTAPILSTNDAADLLPIADHVLVVSRAHRTTREAADAAAELLERLDAPVLGVIVVGGVSSGASRYYYYYEPDGDRYVTEAQEPVNPLAELAQPGVPTS